MKKVSVISIIGVLVIGIISVLVYQGLQDNSSKNSEALTATLLEQKEANTEPKPFKTKAVIGGIGDILLHDTVYNDALTENGYDFNPMFKPVHSILQKPDFLIANQESTPGGPEFGISSYPTFNSPFEIVDALMEAGVDMVTTANNHSIDRRTPSLALLSAIEYYEKVGLPYTGTFKSEEDRNTIRVMNVNGIKIAVLSYTYGLNGIPIPEGKDYVVNLLDRELILSDIEKAKPISDVVLLALHWGNEYQRQPNQEQRQLADEFIKAGADIIFGHHPHVLQPMQWIEREDGSKGLVIYSLGNFLSGQIWDYKDIGGMIEVTLTKEIRNNETTISIEDPILHPTFSSSIQFANYRVYPLDEAVEKGFTSLSSAEIREFFKEVK